MESLGERLRCARKALNLTTSQMAEKMDQKGRSTWERYEKNETFPNTVVLQSLATLKFDMNWLLTGDGQMWLPGSENASSNSQFKTNMAAESETSCDMTIVWNVAYFLAERSPMLDVDPKNFAEVYSRLCSFLMDENRGQRSLSDDTVEKVVSFAVKLLDKQESAV